MSLAERILYLDVDDTLLVFTTEHPGIAAPLAGDFLRWAMQHFEVRWLTAWCPSGEMRPQPFRRLMLLLGIKGEDAFRAARDVDNPMGWQSSKTEAIDWNDPRPWAWVEDELLDREREVLVVREALDNFITANVSRDPTALCRAWRALADRFELPGAPEEPYPITPIGPTMAQSREAWPNV